VDLGSVRSLLARVAAGDLPVEEAMGELSEMTFVDLGELKPDVLREVRTGQAEAVFGPGKTPEQVGASVATLVRESAGAVFVTRATAEQYEAARRVDGGAVYYPRCGLVVVRSADGAPTGRVALVSAGTSDLPVADEAALTAEALRIKVERVTDVGVAGVHRALAYRPTLEEVDCVVVVAGMEGALPSLVAGLVSSPVVAVPTSVGYGASFGGLAALLAMLSSCAPGVVVVNVDNGFGAALAAHRIVRR
jgi:NCAIR mutase (PurE)-related protein